MPGESAGARSAVPVAWLESSERRFGLAATALGYAVVLTLLSLVLAAPTQIVGAVTGNDRLLPPGCRFELSFLPIAEHPWTAQTPEFPQLRQRILGPLLSHAVGLDDRRCALVPLLASIPFLALLYALLRWRMGASLATCGTALLATTMVTLTGQTWAGYQDTLANLGTLIALAAPWPPVSALGLAFGALADERVFAAAPLVLVWHGLRDPKDQFVRRGVVRTAWIALAGLAWAGHAAWTIERLGLSFDELRQEAALPSWRHPTWMLAGWIEAFRAAWFMPVALAWAWRHARQRELVVLGVAFLPILASSAVVLDVTRVCSFGFPIILIAMMHVQAETPARATKLCNLALLANVLLPVAPIVDQMSRLQPSLPYWLLLRHSP